MASARGVPRGYRLAVSRRGLCLPSWRVACRVGVGPRGCRLAVALCNVARVASPGARRVSRPGRPWPALLSHRIASPGRRPVSRRKRGRIASRRRPGARSGPHPDKPPARWGCLGKGWPTRGHRGAYIAPYKAPQSPRRSGGVLPWVRPRSRCGVAPGRPRPPLRAVGPPPKQKGQPLQGQPFAALVDCRLCFPAGAAVASAVGHRLRRAGVFRVGFSSSPDRPAWPALRHRSGARVRSRRAAGHTAPRRVR